MMTNNRIASIFGFALMVAYWPGIAGAPTTGRWDIAALLAIALFFAPKVRFTAAHVVGLMLVGWLLLSLLWNDGGQDGLFDGIDAAAELMIACTAFAVGSTLEDLGPLFTGAALGIAVNSAFALAQFAGLPTGVETGGFYSGLFYNAGRLGAAAALVTVAIVGLRKWLLLSLLLPALILTGSRAAWLAAICGLVAIGMQARSRQSKWLVWGVAMAAVIAALLVAHHGSGGFERLAIWNESIQQLTWLGHGLGSFREDFLKLNQTFDFAKWGGRPEHPHNEWLWFAYEGGCVGFSLALIFACSIWRASEGLWERGVLVGLAVLSLFAMPFHDPVTVVLGALCAGSVAGRGADQRYAAYDRRLALFEGLGSGID